MKFHSLAAAFVLCASGLPSRGANHALRFDGVDDHVALGTATDFGIGGPPTKGLTLECWFRREGTGIQTDSGFGGVMVVPLFAKGRGEQDGSRVDCNYIFGIDSNGHLAADFESITNGQNYPVTGTHEPISLGVWHHAAATYEGNAGIWTLYLDGIPVGSANVPAGTVPRHDSIHHFAIATALDSGGVPEGAFAGVIDEVRIWDFAKSASEIGDEMVVEIDSAPGLVGRFGFNEGSGTTVSSGSELVPGTLVGAPIWTTGAPFVAEGNLHAVVTISAPAGDTQHFLSDPLAIAVDVTDSDGNVVKVELRIDGIPVAEDFEAPYNFEWMPTAPGPHVISAVATDNDGTPGFSSGRKISVVYPSEEIPSNTALLFDGTDDFVTMGPAPELNVGGPPGHSFTLECWFRRTAAGQTAHSGAGGVRGVPLFGKGRGEADGSKLDCNVFFGIDAQGRLVADFEDFQNGQNHPVTGSHPPIADAAWHHGAATFDGAAGAWTLYLDGVVVGNHTIAPVGAVPNFGSIQHFGIGSSLNSAGVREGAFAGAIDEVRVWNHVRSGADIMATKNSEISAATGLVARFGLNEGTGLQAASTDDTIGTLTNKPHWVGGFPGPENAAPTVELTSPAAGSVATMPYPIEFAAAATDADGISKVEFHVNGIKAGESTGAPHTFAWSPPAAGDYQIRALARDAFGAGKLTPPVALTVIPNPNQAPVASLNFPAAAATVPSVTVNLKATLADPESDPMTVTFYGRETTPATPGADFTVVAIPDTQYYSEGDPAKATGWGITKEELIGTFSSQTGWIVSNRDTRNIAFASHMGDIVESGGIELEWQRADAAMSLLEDPLTTLREHGIPFGAAPGNHDFHPLGAVDTGSTELYNRYFGINRYTGRSYWGGNFGANANNNYQLFSASGLDFVILHLAYDPTPATAVLDWADAVLKAFPHRRAIVSSHHLILAGNPADFSVQGAAVYQRLKNNPNFFLMLCGHISAEGYRRDVHQGRAVHTILSDYQELQGGGNGFLRTLIFSPAANRIRVESWSPTLGRAAALTDGLPHFDGAYELDYNMQSAVTGWIPLGTVQVPAGGTSTQLAWTGLRDSADYEWYAAVSDGLNTTATVPRRFVVKVGQPPTSILDSPADGTSYTAPAEIPLRATAADGDGSVVRVEFRNGQTLVASAESAPFEAMWSAVLPGIYPIAAVAIDSSGLETISSVSQIRVLIEPTTPTAGTAAVAKFGPPGWSILKTSPAPHRFDPPPGEELELRIGGESVQPAAGVNLIANADLGGARNNFAQQGFEAATSFVHVADSSSPDFPPEIASVVVAHLPFAEGWTGAVVDADGVLTTSSLPQGVELMELSSGIYRIRGLSLAGTMQASPVGAGVGSLATVTQVGNEWEIRLGDSAGTFTSHAFSIVYLPPAAAHFYAARIGASGGISHKNQAATDIGLTAATGVDGLDLTFGDGAEINPATAAVFLTSATPGKLLSWSAVGNSFRIFSQSPGPVTEIHEPADVWIVAIPYGTAPRPEVSIHATDSSAGEFGADQTLEFVLTRSGPLDSALEIPLVAAGSAIAGFDYSGFVSPVVIPTGQADVTLNLTVLADELAEGPETLTLELEPGEAFVLGEAPIATAEIFDRPAQSYYFLTIPDAEMRSPLADPDGDSHANVVEYFMGTLPTDADSRGVLEIPLAEGGVFKVRYPRAKNRPDVTGSLRWSSDLLTWRRSGETDGTVRVDFLETVFSDPIEDPETIEASIALSGDGVPSIFVRLAVE